jgi:putative membrane protein
MKLNDKIWIPTIIILSMVIPLAVAVLIYFPLDLVDIDANFPLFHATINGTVSILLVLALYLVKSGKHLAHRNVMLTAFALSSVFLVSYVLSKVNTPPTPFGGEGLLRSVYFFILISHIFLATFIVPLALFSIYRGIKGEFGKHKRISKWTWPIWFYVSVTGVLVYWFMAPYY